MKKDILDIVCCPTCKSSLTLEIKKEVDDEIIKGVFTCEKCKCDYEVIEGIPSFLPKN